MHHDLLQSGAGGSGEADRTVVDHIGEAQRKPVDAPCPTIRAHHEQSGFACPALERNLVGDAHVVAEDEGMDISVQEPMHLGRHVLAGDGDDGEVGLAEHAHRPFEGAGRTQPRPVGYRRRIAEKIVHLREQQIADRGVCDIGHDDQVRRFGAVHLGGVEPGSPEDFFVGRRTHHDRHLVDAVGTVERVAQLHEPQRVLICVRLDDRIEHAARQDLKETLGPQQLPRGAASGGSTRSYCWADSNQA